MKTGMVIIIAKNVKTDLTEISYLFDRLSSLIPNPMDRKNIRKEIKGNIKEVNPLCGDNGLVA